MTWNYRIIEKTEGETGNSWLAIHEVYYDGDEIISWSADPINMGGESLEELRSDLEYRLNALDMPILKYSELPKNEHDNNFIPAKLVLENTEFSENID